MSKLALSLFLLSFIFNPLHADSTDDLTTEFSAAFSLMAFKHSTRCSSPASTVALAEEVMQSVYTGRQNPPTQKVNVIDDDAVITFEGPDSGNGTDPVRRAFFLRYVGVLLVPKSVTSRRRLRQIGRRVVGDCMADVSDDALEVPGGRIPGSDVAAQHATVAPKGQRGRERRARRRGANGNPDLIIPPPSQFNAGPEVVAVLDSGMNIYHEDMQGQLWTEDDPNGCLGGHGYNFDPSGTDICDITDFSGHGTATGSLVSAIQNNGLGIDGNCRDCRVMSFRLGDTSWARSTVINALNYALSRRVRTINYSGGGTTGREVWTAALDYPIGDDYYFTFSASSGNSNKDVDTEKNWYPAEISRDLPHVLGVGSHSEHTPPALSWFSNYGATGVSIFAQGSTVEVLLHTGTTGTTYRAGTSFSAPQVTAVCARYVMDSPALTGDVIKTSVLGAAIQVPALQGLCVSNGALNFAAAPLE